MREAREDLFRFPDIEGSLIQILLLWMYTGNIYLDPLARAVLKLPATDGTLTREMKNKIEDEMLENDDPSFVLDSSEDEGVSEAVGMGYREVRRRLDVDTDTAASVDHNDTMEMDGAESEDTDDLIHEAVALYQGFGPTPERRLINRTFNSDQEPEELDTYQLRCLLQLHEDEVDNPAHWIFCSKWRDLLLEKERGESHQIEDVSTAAHESTYTQLIELYILADRLDAPALRVQTMDHLQHQRGKRIKARRTNTLPSFRIVRKAFDNLPPRSPLRLWLTDIFAHDWNPSSDSPAQVLQRRILPQDFVLDVMLINTRRLNDSGCLDVARYDLDKCCYHAHESMEESMRCRWQGNFWDRAYILRPDLDPNAPDHDDA